MKRKIVLLAISGFAVLSSMLALSYITAKPAIAQTPTPIWMECSDEQSFDVSAPAGPVPWSGSGVMCGGTYTNCADVVGIYGTLDNVVYTGGGGGCSVDSRDNGINPVGGDNPPSWATNIYPEACADNDDTTCSAFGFTKLTGFNPENLEDELVGLGGLAQWCSGSNISFDARVCVMFKSPPPPVPDCGVGYITDTHFISNSWTTSGAFWYYSFYDIGSGGAIYKQGNFSDGEGNYLVNVYARSSTTATLMVSIGGAATPITISAGSAIDLYTGTVAVVGVTPNVRLEASGNLITVDQVCINEYQLNCGIIYDYHFISPYSFAGTAGATWAMNDLIFGTPNGNWTLLSGQSIKQTISAQAGGYTLSMRARSYYGDASDVGILIDGVEAAIVTVPGGWIYYDEDTISGTITLEAGYKEFELITDGGVVVDWVCLESASMIGAGPCGITSADMAKSLFYIADSKFENGIVRPAAVIGQVGIPLGASFGLDSQYDLMQGWTQQSPNVLGIAEGMYRVHGNGPSLGLVPVPIGSNVFHNFSQIDGGFNVVLRMNRQYQNARVLVSGQSIGSGSTPGEWEDASAYIPDSSASIIVGTDCGENLALCIGPVFASVASAIIDDVYIVPGPALVCGAMAPITTTIGNCINPNPDFLLGSTDWSVFNGAYVDNTYGWAVMPGGSYIQQSIPTGGTWGQSSGGLNVGYSYIVAVGAHLEDSGSGGQYTVILGASQPGELSFNHQVVDTSSTESTDSFTITTDMLNATQFDLRVVNEAGGTVMLDYVCIRYNGKPGVLPPVGQCLGSWTTSDGSSNAVGGEIPSNNYVKNEQAAMGGGYAIDLAGETDDEAGSTFTVQYCNATSGICDDIGPIPLEQEFSTSFPFVVPAGGYYGGELRINNDDAVTYDNLCLRQSQNGPIVNPPSSPPPLPMPECGSVNNIASFYKLAPYSVTNEFTGTEYTAAYLSEMIYNYSIYPLVCTTISIGNWQYKVYAEFKALFNQYVAMMTAKLDYIIEILLAILDKIGTGTGGDPWWLDLLNLFLLLLKLFLEILLKLLSLIFAFLAQVVEIFAKISGEARGENAIAYPLDCGGDGAWMCFVLAGIAELDYNLGDWLNIISLIVVAALTVSLVFWVVNQASGILQPGAGGDTSG